MSAYVALQQEEFASEIDGYTATKHQREVGAGYFDSVTQAVAAGNVVDHRAGWARRKKSSSARTVSHAIAGSASASRGARKRAPAGRSRRCTACRQPVEELDDAGFQVVLRTHHDQPVVVDELLQNVRPVPQVIRGHADVLRARRDG